MIDPNGIKTDYTYNLDNSLASVAYLDGNNNPHPTTPVVSYEYDSFYNRVSKVTTAGMEERIYSYVPINSADTVYGDGRLQTETVKDLIANPAATLHALTHAYDEYGRELSCSIDGVASGRTFDSLGRVATAVNALGSFGYHYIGATGRLSHVDYPNGQRTKYAYHPAIAAQGSGNGDFRLKQILNTVQNGTRVISQFDYEYDAAGNILNWTQEQESFLAKQNYQFGYDPADQLIGAALTDVATGNILQEFGYKYDLAGNREVEQIATVQPNGSRELSLTQASHNALNQMTSRTGGSGAAVFEGTLSEPAKVKIGGTDASAVWKKGANQYGFRGTGTLNAGANTIHIEATDGNNNTGTLNVNVQSSGVAIPAMTYDSNGNLLSDGSRTYAWDAVNRLLSITYADNSKTEFRYNGIGQRTHLIERDGSNTITEDRRFVWCGMDLREERNAANQVVKRFEAQGVSQGSQPSTLNSFYYTRDHLGSVRQLTDSAKAVRSQSSYDPWGRKKERGGLAHHDSASGYRQHFFKDSPETMSVETGDKLVTYVYLDPQNAPRQIMLQWNVADDWSHRAYWGENLVSYGVDGTASHRRIGDIPMPASAGWVRLEVPASDVGLEGQTVSGMSFDTYDGVVTWDHSGKVTANGSETVWFDDAIPAGATVFGTWDWVRTAPEADFSFTGHFYHRKSGLHLAYYRAYSAELGRWLNRDPINERGGLNLYHYCYQNPASALDSDGRFVFLLAIPFAVGAIETAVASVAITGGIMMIAGAVWDSHQNQAVVLTPEQEAEKDREYDEYKDRCSQKPPPNLNCPCALARWLLQRDQDCLAKRQAWHKKWDIPGTPSFEKHARAIAQQLRTIANDCERLRTQKRACIRCVWRSLGGADVKSGK